MDPCLLSLITLGTVSLQISVLILLGVKGSITHGTSSVTWTWLNSLFGGNLTCSLILMSNHCYLLLLVNLIILFASLIGAESLRTWAIHYNSRWRLLILDVHIFRCLFIAHYTASKNTINCSRRNLSLITLMVPHTVLSSDVHIWSTSLSSHTVEHNLTLLVSSTFII